jgi:hypothetical protein
MTDYEKHLQQRGLKHYTIDGAINPAKWAESEVKVLFLLKENYGYEGCGVQHVRDIAIDSLAENNRTYTKCTSLVAAIEIGLQRGCPLSPDEINALSKDQELLSQTLEKIAVVNIKKHSGTTRSDKMEIYEESGRNKPLLESQILELAPTVIVAGGEVCWHCLIYNLELFKDAPDCPKFHAVVCRNTVLCYANHPAAWQGRGFDIPALHLAVLSALRGRIPVE